MPSMRFEVSETDQKRGVWAFLVAYGFLAAVQLVAGLESDPRTWGFHAFAFMPRLVWVAALGVLTALVVPRVAGGLAEGARSVGSRVVDSPWKVLGIAILAGVLFYVERLQFQFLGDGAVWLRRIASGEPFHHFEPLATYLVRTVARQTTTPEEHAGLASIGLGVFYVLLAAFLCRRAWHDPLARGLGWLLLLLHPSILLFFGYVESYPLLLVLQVLLALLLLRVTRANASLVGPALVLAIAIASHLQAVSWLPAWVAVVATRGHGDWKTSLLRSAAWCTGILATAIAILLGVGASPTALLGRLGSESALGAISFSWFFSGAHVLDLVNEALLLLAVPGLLGVGAWAAGFRPRDLEARWIPIAWMLPGPLLFAWVVQPRIGGARDWDLYLSMALPAVLLAVEAWRRVWRPETATGSRLESDPRVAGGVQAGRALGLAAVACFAWLAVQLDEERGARRMIVLQESQGTFGNFARGYANETLGMYFRGRDPRAARDAYARAVEANPLNARYFNNLGNTELRLGNTAGALDAFRNALDLGMRDWYVLHNASLGELELGRPERALPLLDEFVENWPDKWEGFAIRGKANLDLGRLHQAQADLHRSLLLRPNDADIHYTLGLVLRNQGQLDEARHAFERALDLDPKHPQARRVLDRLQSGP